MSQNADSVRWVRDPDGTTTTFEKLDDFYDALFERGVTVPGASGFVTNEDGSVIEWGVQNDGSEGGS